MGNIACLPESRLSDSFRNIQGRRATLVCHLVLDLFLPKRDFRAQITKIWRISCWTSPRLTREHQSFWQKPSPLWTRSKKRTCNFIRFTDTCCVIDCVHTIRYAGSEHRPLALKWRDECDNVGQGASAVSSKQRRGWNLHWGEEFMILLSRAFKLVTREPRTTKMAVFQAVFVRICRTYFLE